MSPLLIGRLLFDADDTQDQINNWEKNHSEDHFIVLIFLNLIIQDVVRDLLELLYLIIVLNVKVLLVDWMALGV